MALIERLGSFYLGKEYDLGAKQVLDKPVNYDSRDLVTHGVCVGMTGSGKTGLCIDLLEEAALDGVPAIIIDPKGDITNLLLTFPELRPEDFRPWINEDDARRKGMDADAYAAKTAQSWREGLTTWDQGPERIRMLQNAAEFAIYTPGSEAGLPISILASLQAPTLDWDTESETLRDRIQGTISALLGLIGIEADPVRSREHILLSNIVETAWRAGQDLEIAKLILSVQKPPFRQLGVFDLDSFYPEKDRFELAMALNNIVASSSFASWLKGDPLDVGRLLHTGSGKPQHSIFYIAHLNDAERMFFVTLLLEQVISWMRAQSGTTSLRAILYMDEVFGFFPPVSEPPSKRPMLTLLKQARAFGVGVMLTTQNPVDVDYKGLTNAGTWFIGKLQAERDKARLLEGLQSAMAEAGSLTDIKQLEKIISSLDSRVFLLHDVNLSQPIVFSTRWAMSYLRGPLTRQQIKQLMAPRKAAAPAAALAPTATPAGADAGAGVPARPGDERNHQPPVLPPGVNQVYLPTARTASQATHALEERTGGAVRTSSRSLVYEPSLIGFASVQFVDRKLGVDTSQDVSLLLPLSGGVIDWKDAEPLALEPRDLEEEPGEDAQFVGDLPAGITDARGLKKQEGALVDYLYRSQSYSLAQNPTLKLYARTGESERDFRVRCQQAAREGRDDAVDKLRDKYETQLRRIEEKLSREERDLAQNQAQFRGRETEELLSGVASIAGALGLFGRRSSSLRGLSTAASKRRMTGAARSEIAASEADIARMKAQIDDLKAALESDANDLTRQWDSAAEDIQQVSVTPRKTDVRVQMVAIAWAPRWEIAFDDVRGRSRSEYVPAYPQPSEA